MQFEVYKKGQGQLARWIAAGFLGVLVLFGCYELYWFLYNSSAFDFFRSTSLGTIPFVDQDLNIAFILVVVLFAAGVYGTYWISNLPKAADLLIDTETEMKKVTWPSWPEAMNSSMVVVAAVLVLAIYLAGVDFVLNQFFEVIFPH
ncbi:MAG: preprotein translocase subunit SecE [Planctomycetes bacterium]|nr:preprotein translocase subunit SecE [Planctomycetota bacterium]